MKNLFNKSYKKKLKKIANHYGCDHQELKLLEEMGEYISAKCRLITENRSDVAERILTSMALTELADVIVVLEQVLYFYKKTDKPNYEKIKRAAKGKIDRQISRMENENVRQQ